MQCSTIVVVKSWHFGIRVGKYFRKFLKESFVGCNFLGSIGGTKQDDFSDTMLSCIVHFDMGDMLAFFPSSKAIDVWTEFLNQSWLKENLKCSLVHAYAKGNARVVRRTHAQGGISDF